MKKLTKLNITGFITFFIGVTFAYFVWLTWKKLTDYIGDAVLVWCITGGIVLIGMIGGYLSFGKIMEKFA